MYICVSTIPFLKTKQCSLLNLTIPNTRDHIIQMLGPVTQFSNAKPLVVCIQREVPPVVPLCKPCIARLCLVVLAASADGRRPRKARVGEQVSTSSFTSTTTSLILITGHCCISRVTVATSSIPPAGGRAAARRAARQEQGGPARGQAAQSSRPT